jgi:hypothetical protein
MPFLDDAQRWTIFISPLHDLYIPWLLSFAFFFFFDYPHFLLLVCTGGFLAIYRRLVGEELTRLVRMWSFGWT